MLFLSFEINLWGSVIFIQLGENIPSCLFSAMKQAKAFDPTVYLLADKIAYAKLPNDFFADEGIECVDMEMIPMSELHRQFCKEHPIDCSIAGGLWVYATERFFTLFDFMREKQLEKVLHLESDTMLYISWDEWAV